MSEVFIPHGWMLCKLGEVCTKPQYGYTTKASDKGHVKFLRTTDITKGNLNWDTVPFCLEAPENIENYQLENRDIVISRAGSIGFSCLLKDPPQQAVFASYLIRFKPSPNLNELYLKHFLGSGLYWTQLAEQAAGNAVQNVNAQKLSDLDIYLPPLAEQYEIAARLDDLLARVDILKTRLDAIPSILKRFRQSTLAAAVSGKLTEEWRKQTTYMHPVECDDWKWSDIPETWSVIYYEKAVDSRLGKMLDRSKNSGLSISYLGNINVRWFVFDLSNLQQILALGKEIADLSVKRGDVLICEGGEPGRAAIWTDESERTIIYQKALHRARVSKHLMPEWLVFNLKNDADKETLNQLFTGTTIKHLTGKALRQYPLRVPPFEEQAEIVRRVEELFAFADQIAQRVRDAQIRINKLTKSILAKAFRGDLTADWRAANPDLITGENSAEALLAQIRSERKELAPKKRCTRRLFKQVKREE